jgi:hypothetical protein
MTPEKEIEIIRWMKDNYPTFETNQTQIWQIARMLNDYHESEVKKLNIPAVIKSVCQCCGKRTIDYFNTKCKSCGTEHAYKQTVL